MSSTASFPLISLLDRAVEALSKVDTASLKQIAADCDSVAISGTAEEWSRALTQHAALEKTLEQTRRNLLLLRAEERLPYRRYGDSGS